MMNPVATVYICERLKAVPTKVTAAGTWVQGTSTPSNTQVALRESITTPPYWVLPEWETTIQFDPPPYTAGKLCELSVDLSSCIFDGIAPTPGEEASDSLVTYAVQLSLPQPNGYASVNTTNTDWYGKTVVQATPPGSNHNQVISFVSNHGYSKTVGGSPILVRIPQGPQPLRLSLIQNELVFVETFTTPDYSFSAQCYGPEVSPKLQLLISLEPVE